MSCQTRRIMSIYPHRLTIRAMGSTDSTPAFSNTVVLDQTAPEASALPLSASAGVEPGSDSSGIALLVICPARSPGSATAETCDMSVERCTCTPLALCCTPCRPRPRGRAHTWWTAQTIVDVSSRGRPARGDAWRIRGRACGGDAAPPSPDPEPEPEPEVSKPMRLTDVKSSCRRLLRYRRELSLSGWTRWRGDVRGRRGEGGHQRRWFVRT